MAGTTTGVGVVVSDGAVWWSDGADAWAVTTTVGSPLVVGTIGDTLLLAEYTGGDPAPAYISANGSAASRWDAVGGVGWERGAAVGGVLYFAGWDAAGGTELWRTDGSTAGTWRVADLVLGPAASSPHGFVAAADLVYFVATRPGFGDQPWVTDGTAAGTHELTGISTPELAEVRFLAPDGAGGAFFAAARVPFATGVWHTDGTLAGTRPLADVGPATADSVLVNGIVYFHADDGCGMGLWRSDGTSMGTWLVKRGTVPDGRRPTIAAMGGVVYFSGFDPATGWELWRTDGGPGSADLVRDIRPGPASGVAHWSVVSVEEAGVLLFDADGDASTGRELWVSDGTPAGTRLLQDLLEGAAGSSPGGFTRAGGRVYFHANGAFGRELWSVPLSAIDRRAPIIVCPRDVVAEATSAAGASVAYPSATSYDGVTAVPSVRYSAPRGSMFPIGSTVVAATAIDDAGNSASCNFSVIVRDRTAPTLACPPDIIAEATSPEGAAVWYAAATVADAVTSAPTLAYSVASGSLFPFGVTDVRVASSDIAGNVAVCSFQVIVRDSMAPTLVCPHDVTAEASGPRGAAVAFQPATATDRVTTSPALAYSAESGSVFPIGDTIVTVTATDQAWNIASCSFHVNVRDTTAPTIVCPASIEVPPTTEGHATVTFPSPSAADAVTNTPAISTFPESGSLFTEGLTTVTAAARDDAGNTARCTFTVNVVPLLKRDPLDLAPDMLSVGASGLEYQPVQGSAAKNGAASSVHGACPPARGRRPSAPSPCSSDCRRGTLRNGRRAPWSPAPKRSSHLGGCMN